MAAVLIIEFLVLSVDALGEADAGRHIFVDGSAISYTF